jgi:hypothetical protein
MGKVCSGLRKLVDLGGVVGNGSAREEENEEWGFNSSLQDSSLSFP